MKKSENWSWSIQFIMHKKNNRYHEGIKQIPYVLRYGQPCRVGLSKMNLPPGLLSQLESEEDLEAVRGSHGTDINNSNTSGSSS
jgi:hypothetical protein